MPLPKLSLLSLLALIGSASAATLVNEDFSYADGSLVGNGGWISHDGNTPGQMMVTGGAVVVLEDGSDSEDTSIVFPSTSTGVTSATFDIVVSSDPFGVGTDFEYFAHFRNGAGFRSRVDVVAPTLGGDFTLGISTGTSIAEAVLPVDFSFGETVSLQLDYNFGTNRSSLTVGANTISGLVNGTSQIDAFNFRQSNSSNDETITIDNLVITGTIPEPSSALLLLSAIGFVAVRRRK